MDNDGKVERALKRIEDQGTAACSEFGGAARIVAAELRRLQGFEASARAAGRAQGLEEAAAHHDGEAAAQGNSPFSTAPWHKHHAKAIRALLSAQPAEEVQPAAVAQEPEEDAFVIQKLGNLLAGVCIALKGPEQELHRHSYHDIVDVAEKIKLELDLFRAREEATPPAAQAVEADARDAAIEALPYLRNHEDCGPFDEGWQSDALEGLIRRIEAIASQAKEKP